VLFRSPALVSWPSMTIGEPAVIWLLAVVATSVSWPAAEGDGEALADADGDADAEADADGRGLRAPVDGAGVAWPGEAAEPLAPDTEVCVTGGGGCW
jgi:hypothetical protein